MINIWCYQDLGRFELIHRPQVNLVVQAEPSRVPARAFGAFHPEGAGRNQKKWTTGDANSWTTACKWCKSWQILKIDKCQFLIFVPKWMMYQHDTITRNDLFRGRMGQVRCRWRWVRRWDQWATRMHLKSLHFGTKMMAHPHPQRSTKFLFFFRNLRYMVSAACTVIAEAWEFWVFYPQGVWIWYGPFRKFLVHQILKTKSFQPSGSNSKFECISCYQLSFFVSGYEFPSKNQVGGPPWKQIRFLRNFQRLIWEWPRLVRPDFLPWLVSEPSASSQLVSPFFFGGFCGFCGDFLHLSFDFSSRPWFSTEQIYEMQGCLPHLSLDFSSHSWFSTEQICEMQGCLPHLSLDFSSHSWFSTEQICEMQGCLPHLSLDFSSIF